MTHVVDLRRVDGGRFSAAEVGEVLFALQLAMSFATGRWIAPALPVGFDEDGNRVWEEWAPWRCDHLRGFSSWWDTHRGNDLKDLVRRFVEASTSPDAGPVRHVTMHAITANHKGTTTEGRVMLAQAGIELLTWTELHLGRGLSERNYRRLGAAGRIRRLLVEAAIDPAVPADLPAITKIAAENGKDDAPAALAWVRNKLVHPRRPDEVYEVDGLVWQTSYLLLTYLELLLLHRLGYEGSYRYRYPLGQFEHSATVVPWSGLARP
jgi:hypothetical protein